MYEHPIGTFRTVKHIVSKIVSTDSTSVDSTSIGSTVLGSIIGRALGQNFDLSIKAIGGLCHMTIDSTVNPTTDSLRLSTEYYLNLKCKTGVRLYGASTAVGVNALVWGYNRD